MTSSAWYILTLSGLPWSARLRLLWRRGRSWISDPGPPLFLRLGKARLVLDPADEGDIAAFDDVFSKQVYRTDYRGATVLDIGAHKGYFTVFAVRSGAAGVHAFEPEPRNFDALTRTLESLRAYGVELVARRRGVSASDGERGLLVARESWGHSMLPHPGLSTESERVVRTCRFESLIDRARESVGAERKLIAKVDAEGCECEIVLDTPVSALEQLSEIFIEIHPFAPCDEAEIVGRLESAGLVAVSRRGDVFHLRRLVDDPL